MIQTFVHINDLIPTENWWPDVDDQLEPREFFTREELLDDIRENGFKYMIKTDEHGSIFNGNMRYWTARFLYEQENDKRFEYLPVELNHLAGVYTWDKETPFKQACKDFGKWLNTKVPVIPVSNRLA